jgi:hypothetical protein
MQGPFTASIQVSPNLTLLKLANFPIRQVAKGVDSGILVTYLGNYPNPEVQSYITAWIRECTLDCYKQVILDIHSFIPESVIHHRGSFYYSYFPESSEKLRGYIIQLWQSPYNSPFSHN